MTLGPVVPCSALPEHKIIWSKDLSKRSGSDTVHGSWLQIDKHSSGYILATAGFVIVNIDSL